MKLQGAEKFTDEERSGLSEAELEVLEGDDDDADALGAVANEEDEDDDNDADAGTAEADKAAAAKAAQEKADAAAKAKEDAEAKAAAAAEAKAKADAEAKVKAAADAAAETAKKAGADAAAQKKASDDAAEKARTEAAAAAAEAEEETATATVEQELEDDDPFVPPYVAPKPEKYDERMTAFDKREDDVVAKFKAGDIELEAMNKEQRAIQKERSALEREMERHTVTADLAEKAGERHWQWEVNRFIRDVKKHEGIDYADSIRLNTALDAEVKAIANKPENADKPGRWFLTEAHKAVKEKLGVKPSVAPAKKDDAAAAATAKAKAEADAKAKAAAVKAAAAARKAPTDKLPKTLGGLPAAGGVDIGNDGEGEFAEVNALMDKGDSMAVEAYIAGKSAEWQERWARNS